MAKARSGFLIICLLGLCGCSLFTTTVDESDAGSIQRPDVGDLLVIRLLGNASTGYEWARVEPVSLAESPLDIIAEGDYQTPACQLVGSPGEFIFRYRAMRPGTVALRFEYRQSWDATDPIDSYSVTVWVR
jgi:predicted secreted protein